MAPISSKMLGVEMAFSFNPFMFLTITEPVTSKH
jgi:hypothetical protein